MVFLQIKEHVIGIGIDVPFVLLGGPGTGKSSIMARVSDVTVSKALLKEIPGYVSIEWKHWGGSAFCSTSQASDDG